VKACLLTVLLATVACTGDPRRPADLPGDWIVVQPPTPGSDAARCANWARDGWAVALASDSSQLLIRPQSGYRYADTLATTGGRLTAVDNGEFGGEVWWEPTIGAKRRIADANLHIFVTTSRGIWGLAGLAHLGTNEGQLLHFELTAAGWKATAVASLGAAPRSVTHLGGDTLLVGTVGSLVEIVPPAIARARHRNPVWMYTGPLTTITRDRAGVVYLGMRSAVARLTPVESGYHEDWLVPKQCRMRVPTDSLTTCRCLA
jgi:hypothetical protein